MSGIHARTGGIYVASKTKHAAKWRAYREAGFPIVSTWIDEAEVGQTQSFADLWMRCVQEASNCAVLVAYHEPDEILKGAFIEIGCALAVPRLVLLAGEGWDQQNYSFMAHPAVKFVDNINTALATGMRASYKFAARAATHDILSKGGH